MRIHCLSATTEGKTIDKIRVSSRTAAAMAVILSVVVYLHSLGNGFALDDTGDIVENAAVHGLANSGEILTSPYRSRVPPQRSPYRPLTSLTYALNWSVGPEAPALPRIQRGDSCLQYRAGIAGYR